MRPSSPLPALALFAFAAVSGSGAQTIPATAPTSAQPATMAPIDATAPADIQSGAGRHRAEVTCNNGQLAIHADNSSLNGILRGVSRCTGMTVVGGVSDQRVFGNYGPAAPATVLATLLDGTGVNMLLQETASSQPARLILTPRTGGATPPSPNQAPDTDIEVASDAQSGMRQQPGVPSNTLYANQGTANPHAALARPGLQPYQGIGNNPNSAVTSPQQIAQPLNNVNGSPINTSPTASTYPTTNSVPIDTLPTPSTTPSSNGIVDAPNPPAAGSDTAALLNGTTTAVPGTTNIQGADSGSTTTPGATNTTRPAGTGDPLQNASPTGQNNGNLTPQQVFEQLRNLQQQIQQQGGQSGNSTPQ